MFEPLKDLIGDHGVKLYQLLSEIRDHLSEISNNTYSEVEYMQYSTENGRAIAKADGTAAVELQANEGYSWRVERVGLTGDEEGNCAVYVGAVVPENLVDVFRGTGITATRGKYFVPRGQAIIFHFYEQTPEQICTANLQVEQLVPTGKTHRAARGTDREAIDTVRPWNEVPSGMPLEETQIGAR